MRLCTASDESRLTAVRLARYFGNSAEFWMNLQSHYELRLERRALREQVNAIRSDPARILTVNLPIELPRLRGSSVVLRPFDERDVNLVMSVASDPLIHLVTSVPTSGSRDDATAYIERQQARLVTGAGYSFAIAEAQTDEAVGQIGLWLADIQEGRASTGYWIAPQFRRRGYARAALSTLTEWALTLHDVHRVQLYVEPWNEGSRQVAEACGYAREGLLRSWQQVGSARRDMFMYSVVRRYDALTGVTPEGSA